MLQTRQCSKNHLSIQSLLEGINKGSVHIVGYLAKKLKKRLTGSGIDFW